MRRERNAFTLVELLVVIAIISVLAAMLLPTLEKSLSAARTIQCANNERNLFLGWQMYIDNHQGWLPKWASAYNNPTAPNQLWPTYMAPYLDTAVVYVAATNSYRVAAKGFLNCPGNPWTGNPLLRDIPYPDYGMSYNGIGGDRGHVSMKAYNRLIDVKWPSRQVAFGDSILTLGGNLGWVTINPHDNNAFRHDEQTNILFCDGHIGARDQTFLDFGAYWSRAPWGNPR